MKAFLRVYLGLSLQSLYLVHLLADYRKRGLHLFFIPQSCDD